MPLTFINIELIAATTAAERLKLELFRRRTTARRAPALADELDARRWANESFLFAIALLNYFWILDRNLLVYNIIHFFIIETSHTAKND